MRYDYDTIISQRPKQEAAVISDIGNTIHAVLTHAIYRPTNGTDEEPHETALNSSKLPQCKAF